MLCLIVLISFTCILFCCVCFFLFSPLIKLLRLLSGCRGSCEYMLVGEVSEVMLHIYLVVFFIFTFIEWKFLNFYEFMDRM